MEKAPAGTSRLHLGLEGVELPGVTEDEWSAEPAAHERAGCRPTAWRAEVGRDLRASHGETKAVEGQPDPRQSDVDRVDAGSGAASARSGRIRSGGVAAGSKAVWRGLRGGISVGSHRRTCGLVALVKCRAASWKRPAEKAALPLAFASSAKAGGAASIGLVAERRCIRGGDDLEEMQFQGIARKIRPRVHWRQ